MTDGIQLKMNFDYKENFLREFLEQGKFSVHIEISPYLKTEKKSRSAANHALEIMHAVSESEKLNTGIAVTDKLQSSETIDSIDFFREISDGNHNRHILYLSGKNSTFDEMKNRIAECRTEGIANIVPVTGNHIYGENIKKTRRRNFTEDIHVLNYLAHLKEGDFSPGCIVNPFKYTPEDLFSQFFKLVKKIRLGSRFIVAQCGWDMLKLQELQWYLTYRGIHYPALARIMILSPEMADDIASGKVPGIHISKDFQKILDKESSFSYKQFEAAQWRRIQIMVAGAKLLGFSGVQLAGLRNAEQVKIALRRVEEALDEFTNFTDWKTEYNHHLSRAEMAPYPNRHYLFENLFTEVKLPEKITMNPKGIREPDKKEKFRCKLSEKLFLKAHRHMPDEKFLLKKILAGCRKCSYCRLPLMHYVCPETCPKGLSNGSCGGTKADGRCELSDFECVHSKRIRLASWRKEFDSLEEKYIKCPEEC